MNVITPLLGKPNIYWPLTEKRAIAIKQQLVTLGVKEAFLTVKGMGDQKPLVSNDTEQGRITNTRIEIFLQ